MSQNTNPLRKYFRQPAIYIRLPSGGKYWIPGSVNMPENGELPVLPMTAIDEITYRTPDALFNGQATVSVIQSCIPNIKDAWSMPGCDLNSILIAIRVASYGHEMDLSSTCPNCATTSDYAVDLRQFLDQIVMPDYNQTSKISDLEFVLKPITYKDQNAVSLSNFENQKTLQQITQSENMDEKEKMARMAGIMQNATKLSLQTIAASVAAIRSPEGLVTEREHIQEFFAECDINLYGSVRDKVIELRNQTEPKPLNITCKDCDHTYTQPINFEMSNFFGTAS